MLRIKHQAMLAKQRKLAAGDTANMLMQVTGLSRQVKHCVPSPVVEHTGHAHPLLLASG